MNARILACPFATPNQVTQLFSGVVRTVEDQGSHYIAHCSSLLYLLDRKLPRTLIQPICNWTFLDPKTCGVDRARYETTVIVDHFEPDSPSATIVVAMAFPAIHPERYKAADWFANGSFEVGFGTAYEPRSIISSSWSEGTGLLTLVLNLPLYQTHVGDRCQVTAGCDGSADACRKFNNFNRFGGFIAVPQRNLTLQAFNNQPVSRGGKK